jgi:glucose/arabinose dehydrogenase
MTMKLERWATAIGAMGLGATLASACAADETPDGPGTGGSGGAATGGTAASTSEGGSSPSGTGGTTAGTGGIPGTGGATPPGGSGGVSTAGTAGADGSAGSPPQPAGCRAPTPNAAVGNACHGTAPPPLVLTEVARDLSAPVFLTHAPGDASRLFVAERGGVIRVIRDGAVETTAFLDISDRVRAGGPAGEQGLLGLAFDPSYAETGRFWLNYTSQDGVGDTVVSSFSGTPVQPADPTSEQVLFSVEQTSFFGNHNGGMIAFGPDGCLYVGMGDGGGGGDPDGHGQNASTALGNLLRVDVDRYPTPAPGNMGGAGVHPHTWDYGLRNPWRFSFDRATGDLYIGDVGQNAWEEVNVEPAGTGHRNYGWAAMEGTHCFTPGCDPAGKTLPVIEHPNGVHKAVIGGYVYRGTSLPGMAGRYVYGDYASRTIWTFVYQGETDGVGQICDAHELSALSPAGDITSFGEDLAGELYVVTLQGIVYRIDPG